MARSLHRLLRSSVSYTSVEILILLIFCRDLSKLHRLRYQGEIALLVTQSETIYISDVEKLCSNLSLNENFFGLQDSNHLLNNASFTEKFHRLSLNMRFSTARKKHSSRSIDVPADSIHPPPVKEPEGLSPSADNGGFFDPLFRPPPSQINPWVYSLLVLIPLRLGISSVNEEYIAVRSPFCSSCTFHAFLGAYRN
jgi:hypothetical protein